MTKPTGTGYLRSHARAKNLASPKRPAESALDRLANAVIDTIAVEHADQGQAFRDAQKSDQPAGVGQCG